MKNIKLSKTSWLILSAGVFLVVLAGLGVTRNQQIQEQTQVEGELGISEMSLSKSSLVEQRYRVDELLKLIEERQTEVDEAAGWLKTTVISADVTEEFYAITDYSGVEVTQFGTTPITQSSMNGIGLSQTSISAQINGTLQDVIDCIINLNSHFTTGYVISSQLSIRDIPESGDDLAGTADASIQMIVYSDEGGS